MEIYYVWFHNYHYDEDDNWVVISKEEYDLIKPYESELSRGNGVKDNTLEDLIFTTIRDREDADLRPSEIEDILTENIIEVALC